MIGAIPLQEVWLAEAVGPWIHNPAAQVQFPPYCFSWSGSVVPIPIDSMISEKSLKGALQRDLKNLQGLLRMSKITIDDPSGPSGLD